MYTKQRKSIVIQSFELDKTSFAWIVQAERTFEKYMYPLLQISSLVANAVIRVNLKITFFSKYIRSHFPKFVGLFVFNTLCKTRSTCITSNNNNWQQYCT